MLLTLNLNRASTAGSGGGVVGDFQILGSTIVILGSPLVLG